MGLILMSIILLIWVFLHSSSVNVVGSGGYTGNNNKIAIVKNPTKVRFLWNSYLTHASVMSSKTSEKVETSASLSDT